MALARIITRHPQEAGLVEEQLRARGYTVETVSSDQTPANAADVEIFLETCAVENALQRAAELASAADAEVFLTPGIFESAQQQSAAAGPEVVLPEPVNGLEPPLVKREAQPRTPQSERPVAESQPIIARTPWQAEPAAERGNVLKDVVAVFAAAVINLAARTGKSLSYVGVRVRQYARELSARTSELRELLRYRLQGWQRRRNAELASRRMAAARRTATRMAAAPRREQVTPGAPLPQVRPKRLPVIRRTREREHEWRVAAVFSGVLAVAVMIAWAAANRRPASPVPTSVLMKSSTLKQQVPFGPVTLPPPSMPTPTSQAKPLQKPSAQKPAVRPTIRYQSEDKEVIVRHFAPVKANTTRTAQSKDGVKRFSDTDE